MHGRRPVDPSISGLMNRHTRGSRDALFKGAAPSSRSGYNETAQNLLESENDAKIDNLADKLSMLKNFSLEIQAEVEEQNDMLDGMGDKMGSAQALLNGTMAQLGKMLESGGNKHMCYLILFVVFILMLLWYVIKTGSNSI